MKLILSGFLLLFLKVNFTLFDYSLVYIFTNILGYLLIRLGIERSEESVELFMKDSLWFYVTMNFILLLCVLFGVNIESISLEYTDSYILAFTILFAHIYLFVYPIYLFIQFIFYLEKQAGCLKSKSIQTVLGVSIALAIIISFSTSVLSSIQYLWVVVIALQLYALVLLKKHSKHTSIWKISKK